MEHKKRNKIGYGLVFFLVMGMLFAYFTFPSPTFVKKDGSWHVIFEGNLAEAAEADPGAGASGILEIFIINHSATPGTTYTQNSSSTLEGWCTAAGLGYCNADDSNVDIAHSTAFDIVVRVRGNDTHCWRTDHWYPADLKVEITCAGLSIGADTDLTGVVSYNNSGADYLWMNFYIDNSGSGYTISKGSTVEITSIKFSAYY